MKDIFRLDIRSLALMRMALALCVLYDLIARSLDFVAHYTDEGALPVAIAKHIVPTHFMHLGWEESPDIFSLHLLNGSPEFQALLFGLQGLFAIGMLVGFKTRLVTILTWIMVISLQNRNVLHFYPGDYLLRMLLLLACFLPTGMAFSIDAHRKRGDFAQPQPQILTLPGAGLILFTILFFVMAGLSKNGQSWSDGTALYYMMIRKRFSTGLGNWMLDYPALMTALTYTTIWFEKLGPFLLLAPFKHEKVRTFAVLALGGMLLSFGTFISIHILPFIGIAGLIGLIPSWVWEQFRLGRPFPSGLDPLRLNLSPARDVLLATVFLLVVWTEWNRSSQFIEGVTAVPLPSPIKEVASYTRIANPWRMFPDTKRLSDGWIVIKANTTNGREVDLLTGKDLSWEEPDNFTAAYGGFRWRRYLRMILLTSWSKEHPEFREQLAKYQCHRWNTHSEDPVTRGEIVVMKLDTYEPGEPAPPPVPTKVASFECQNISQFSSTGEESHSESSATEE